MVEEVMVEVAHRAVHLLEGPLLVAAEPHRAQDSTTRKLVIEGVMPGVVIDVAPRAAGRAVNETPDTTRAQALAGAPDQPPNGMATEATPAAAADAQRQVRNQIRQTRIPPIRARKRTHRALRKAVRRVRGPAAGHGRLRGMGYVVDVRVPITAPLLWVRQPLPIIQP